MPITFSGYLLERLRDRAAFPNVEMTGVTDNRFCQLTFGEIVGEFRRYVLVNQLFYSAGQYENVVRQHRAAHNHAMFNNAGQRAAKLGVIAALDRYGKTLNVNNRLPLAGPGQLAQVMRPLRPGYSVGGGAVNVGTIGGFLWSKGAVYLLSNAHVLAVNPMAGGDTSVVSQPAVPDGGGGAVATVTRHSVLRADDTRLDAAIARVNPTIKFQAIYGELGELTGVRNAVVGETLRMYCRTSGYIEAMVQAVDQTISVSIPINGLAGMLTCNGVVNLTRGIGGWTNRGGDSGGLWIGSDKKACALNFAGGEDSETAAAFPILRVLAFFQQALGDAEAGLVGVDNTTMARSW